MKTGLASLAVARPGLRASRPGFVFLTVLLMLAVAAIILGVAMQRSNMHAAITQRQIDGYIEHHELLGIRDYAKNWLDRQSDAGKLASYAESGEVAHRFALDEGTVLRIYVTDGQGTVLRGLSTVPNLETRRWLAGVLARIPQDRTDLTRRSGPAQVSIRSAPDEVLLAIAGGNQELFSALVSARGKEVKNPVELLQVLDRAGVDANVGQTLSRHLVVEPTLWRLNVEAVHQEGIRRYTLLAEKRQNVTQMHEWRAVGEAEAQNLFMTEEAESRENRASGSRSAR